MIGLMEYGYAEKRSIVFMMTKDFEHINEEDLMMSFMPLLTVAKLYRNWTGPPITTIVPAARLAMQTWRNVRLEGKRSYHSRTRRLERGLFVDMTIAQYTYEHSLHDNPEEASFEAHPTSELLEFEERSRIEEERSQYVYWRNRTQW